MTRDITQVRRGELYFADFGKTNIEGSEQMGERPCLVIQNNLGNLNSGTVIVVCLTSQQFKNTIPVHYKLNGYGRLDSSIVLCEQVKTISKSRLISFCGALSKEDMIRVDEKIQMSLGIIPIYPEAKALTSEATTN